MNIKSAVLLALLGEELPEAVYIFLSLLVGALSSVQSRANGQLSVDIHNAFAASIVSNLIGWTFLWILLISRSTERAGFRRLVKAVKTRELKLWELIAGFAGAFFLSVQALAVPKIGVAMFTICVVGGQTTFSLVVDKIGLSSNGKQHITLPRVITAFLTLFAVFVTVYPELGKANFQLLLIILCMAVGLVVSVQHALNSRVNEVIERSIVTTWLNFLIGTFLLLIALAVDLMHGGSIGPLPHNFWVYIGGPCGLLFIAVASTVVKSMGVLNFILFSVAGQLLGAVLLDWLIPATQGALSSYLIAGTIITMAANALARFYQPTDKNGPSHALYWGDKPQNYAQKEDNIS